MVKEENEHSFIIFPFLKSSEKMPIGSLIFRSTNDTEELTHEQAGQLSEILKMLFLKDDLRVKSATYAIVPYLDLNKPDLEVKHLKNIQNVVAYCYAMPRHEFGDLFLPTEHISMAIFSPGKVPVCLIHPDYHVDTVETNDLNIDLKNNEIDGYAGLYNFKHYFWAAKGSRLYGPNPHIYEASADLSHDISMLAQRRADYRLLMELLKKADTGSSLRIFTALRWFNEANNEANEHDVSIVSLSIAFEVLLGLPREDKTTRFADAVSLLLGRIPRIDVWARQFYDVRSGIVHEGQALQLDFVANDKYEKNSKGPLYQSLLSYGRQIFQLCLGTLLSGVELAEGAGLEEKLFTNEERFQKICRLLSDENTIAADRLESITPIVAAIEQYRYVSESGLKIETMIGAIRLAAKVFLEHEEVKMKDLKQQLTRLSILKNTSNHISELDALYELQSLFEDKTVMMETIGGEALRDLVRIVWGYVFMYYYWIKDRSADKK